MPKHRLIFYALPIAVFALVSTASPHTRTPLSSPHAEAGPRATSLLRELRAFLKPIRTARARVLIQHTAPLEHLRDKPLTIDEATAPELIEPSTISLQRNAFIEVDGLHEVPTGSKTPVRILRPKKLKRKTHRATHGPVLKLIAAALAFPRIESFFDRIGARLEREVLTIDRIDNQLVWAIGSLKSAVWIHTETFQLIRLYVAPNVLDKASWTVQLGYDNDGIGRGWFPSSISIERNNQPHTQLSVTSVEFNPKLPKPKAP